MSKFTWRLPAVSIAGCAFLLVACGQSNVGDTGEVQSDQGAPATAPSRATVWEEMTQVIIPRSTAIWDLAGGLWNDDGKIDASQLKPEQWQQLKDAAQAMHGSASALAAMQKPVVAPAGVKILNEGTAGALGAAEVQAAIDANPQAFQQDAGALVAIAAQLVTAADARDAEKTDALSNQLTEVCGGCHMRFWTPNQ